MELPDWLPFVPLGLVGCWIILTFVKAIKNALQRRKNDKW